MKGIPMFLDRVTELAALQHILARQRGGALVLLYGRRRVGKTALLREWASQSGLPWRYWMAQKEPADLQRRHCYATLRGRPVTAASPTFPSWVALWDELAQDLLDQRMILVLDELPWAMESDPAMLSALQYAWDIHFQQSQLIVVLCGSQIRMMETLLSQQTPLFGRLTAQYVLQPLPFGVLRQFFPAWQPDEQVAAYAMVGGVPQYLSWFNGTRSLSENIRHEILAPASVALAEIELLISDEVRDIRTYLAVLNALGTGAHSLKDIAAATLIAPTNLTKYLGVLQELHLVERRLPATLPRAQQHRSKQGRYHLTDPFHRFYFRFLRPHQAEIAYQPDRVLDTIHAGLRAFVGATAWEELARSWVLWAGRHEQLGFQPTQIGSHWSRKVQADVIAMNWETHDLLIGECKWSPDAIDRSVVRDLLDRTVPQVLVDMQIDPVRWTVRPALIARAGVTPAAQALLEQHQGIVVDLPRLYTDLGDLSV